MKEEDKTFHEFVCLYCKGSIFDGSNAMRAHLKDVHQIDIYKVKLYETVIFFADGDDFYQQCCLVHVDDRPMLIRKVRMTMEKGWLGASFHRANPINYW